MLTTFADTLFRIGTAEPAALKGAFDNRAAQLNAEAMGLQVPRWGQLAARRGTI